MNTLTCLHDVQAFALPFDWEPWLLQSSMLDVAEFYSTAIGMMEDCRARECRYGRSGAGYRMEAFVNLGHHGNHQFDNYRQRKSC